MAIEPTLIKPSQLPEASTVYEDDAMVVDASGAVRKATPVQVVDAGAPVASEAEAIAGADNTKRMTPLRTKQAIGAMGGRILQVVQTSTNTNVVNTTDEYIETGLEATITPSSTSSKILVMVSQSFRVSNEEDYVYGGIRIMRDSTEIYTPASDSSGPYDFGVVAVGSGAVFALLYGMFSHSIIDTPNTTSPVNYKTEGMAYPGASSSSVEFQSSGDTNGTSTIILMEIEV